MVVNPESLEWSQPRRPLNEDRFVRIEEGEDRIVNYHSYADWNVLRPSKWSREETELLIQGIGQFGIDFTLLARLFPNRDRKQLKSKFSRMWKEDPFVFGHHFDKLDVEMDESYNKLLEDLKAERTPKRNPNHEG